MEARDGQQYSQFAPYSSTYGFVAQLMTPMGHLLDPQRGQSRACPPGQAYAAVVVDEGADVIAFVES
ncbi:hypothetical protein Tdes44962_MAKER07120 [Teratosphaeria destructans]|uniref:Uncharacterized protein n=1 Tax=Teratosphaeria destructans TaxID=418781 RepID=A0A9W7W6R8_9PEZI|nr:hypothetical protein Tdes44962_MAKER07120 [Teratosphaeria destructans]